MHGFESQSSVEWTFYIALKCKRSAIVMDVGYYVLMEVSHNVIVTLNVLTLRLRVR